MIAIKSILEEIILATILGKKMLAPRKSKIEIILIIFSVMLFGVSIFFLGLSLNQYLQLTYNSAQSAIIVAVLGLILAVIGWLIAWHLHAKKKLNISTIPSNITQNIKQTIQEIYQEIETPVKDYPKTALLIAAAVGFFAVNNRYRS